MTKLERLIALRLEHLILVDRLAIEIAAEYRNREEAEMHKRSMCSLMRQRQAAIEAAEAAGLSYFDAAGDVDALRGQAIEEVKR